MIAGAAAEGERARRLAEPVVAALLDAGLYRLLLPRALDGAELEPAAFVRVIEEVGRADASAAWRRATGPAGLQCARSVLRRQLAQQGARLISLRSIPFPRLSDRTVAYRATMTGTTPQGQVTAYVDVIALMRSRAHTTITVGSALTTPPRSEELHLARTVAKRMASAMRGA